MNIFKHAIDKRAEAAISMNPSVQTGFLMDTKDVIDQSISNPYFYCLNNMSVLDGKKLQEVKLDPIKSGKSVGLKDTNGLSRNEQMFCNPKWTDDRFLGNSTGKIGLSGGLAFVDVIFSGTNNQAPTIVGVQESARVAGWLGTQMSEADIAANTAVQGFEGAKVGAKATISSKDLVKPSILKGEITPKLLSPDGKETDKRDKSARGTHSNLIRTGTTKWSSTELTNVAMATPMAADWII